MLALAGLPATAGFMGKLYLIEAAVDGDYTWLGVAIAIGTMISLAYYLRVVAAVWMRPAAAPLAPEHTSVPAMAGGSPEADDLPATSGDDAVPAPKGTRCVVILASAALAAGATVFFGILPSPLVDWAANAGQSLAPFIS
jgi:NADH-quinone oxidoreductase subunit N